MFTPTLIYKFHSYDQFGCQGVYYLFSHDQWTGTFVLFWTQITCVDFFDPTHTGLWCAPGAEVVVKFLHIARRITSAVHSHLPSHYVRKHAPCSLPAVCKTKLNAFASMLPRSTEHMPKTISLHSASNKHSVVCHLWHPNLSAQSDMRFAELWVT